MKLQQEKKLDNPVWHALQETHQRFSLTYNNVKCYQPDVCPFGGYDGDNDISGALDEYSKLIDNFYIVGERPVFSDRLGLKNELVCLQMVIDHRIAMDIVEDIVPLDDHRDELMELVNFVQPGYFRTKTPLMGNYYGIFKNNALVAVTGERMQMDEFTEVSAVVTHPDHLRKGYATQLIIYTVNQLLAEKKTPFLHVAETNIGAIRLYENLGFVTRRKISFWNLVVRGRQ